MSEVLGVKRGGLMRLTRTLELVNALALQVGVVEMLELIDMFETLDVSWKMFNLHLSEGIFELQVSLLHGYILPLYRQASLTGPPSQMRHDRGLNCARFASKCR
jgi:hypothetical protein